MIAGSLLINLLVTVAVVCLVFWLITTYLAPLLPPPFGRIVQIVVVVIAIIWLLNLIMPGLGLYHVASLPFTKIG